MKSILIRIFSFHLILLMLFSTSVTVEARLPKPYLRGYTCDNLGDALEISVSLSPWSCTKIEKITIYPFVVKILFERVFFKQEQITLSVPTRLSTQRDDYPNGKPSYAIGKDAVDRYMTFRNGLKLVLPKDPSNEKQKELSLELAKMERDNELLEKLVEKLADKKRLCLDDFEKNAVYFIEKFPDTTDINEISVTAYSHKVDMTFSWHHTYFHTEWELSLDKESIAAVIYKEKYLILGFLKVGEKDSCIEFEF